MLGFCFRIYNDSAKYIYIYIFLKREKNEEEEEETRIN